MIGISGGVGEGGSVHLFIEMEGLHDRNVRECKVIDAHRLATNKK